MLATLVHILIVLLIMALILGLIYWIATLLPLPAPFLRVVQVLIALIFLLVVIYLLLPLTGLRI
jgi:hypothetical protein